jgi:hypothetical protein
LALGGDGLLDDIVGEADADGKSAHLVVYQASGTSVSTGCVLINRQSPVSYPSNNAALHVYGSADFSSTMGINSGSRVQFNASGYQALRAYTYGTHGSGTTSNLTFVRADTTPAENTTYVQGYMNTDGAWYAASNNTHSDIRIKDNIKDLINPLDKVLQLRGRTFTKTDQEDKEKVYIGMIAQEVEPIIPEVVDIPPNPDHMWTIRYGEITALLIEGMKKQQTNNKQTTDEG